MRNSGSILVFVMVIVLVAMALGTGMLTLGTQSRLNAIRQTQNISARCAADSGLEIVVARINKAVETKHWTPWLRPQYEDEPITGSDCTFTVDTMYTVANGYVIRSTGTCRGRSRTVESGLRLKGLFEEGILCRDTLNLKNGTEVGCIDSRISLNPIDEEVTVGTNSIEDDSVVLNNGVVINGDVVVGVGGNVDDVIKDLGADTGDRYALPESIEFPPVSPPNLWGPDTSITINAGDKTIGFGQNYPAIGRYSGINLKQGTRLRVIGSCVLYVTGDVSMGQNSEILLDNNASLKIYVDGDWSSGNNAGINNTAQLPTKFSLYATGGAGQQIDLKAKNDFYGAIYAPEADVTVFSGGDIYGSIAAQNCELKNPGNFYYDLALRQVSVYDEGAEFVVSRWNEN